MMRTSTWRCGAFFIQCGEPLAMLFSSLVNNSYVECPSTDLTTAKKLCVIDTDPRTNVTFPPVHTWDEEALMWLARHIVSRFQGLRVIVYNGRSQQEVTPDGVISTS